MKYKGMRVYVEHGRRVIYLTPGRHAERTYFARYLMEEHLGRELERRENVHHKDGNKLNDVIENLEVLSVSEHTSRHMIGNKYNKVLNDGITHVIVKDCSFCGVEIKVNLSKLKTNNFCSLKCKTSYQNRHWRGTNGQFVSKEVMFRAHFDTFQ